MNRKKQQKIMNYTQDSHSSSWVMIAARHIAQIEYLAKYGWKGSHAWRKALNDARCAINAALFWTPGVGGLLATVGKIDAMLLSDASTHSEAV